MEEDVPLLTIQQPVPISTVFYGSGREEILRLCTNGDIYVHGKLVENDKEVVDAMREFLCGTGHLKKHD